MKLFAVLAVLAFAPAFPAQSQQQPERAAVMPPLTGSTSSTPLPKELTVRFQGDIAKIQGNGPWPMVITIVRQDGQRIEEAKVSLVITRTTDNCRFSAIPVKGEIADDGTLQLADTVDPEKDNLTCRLTLKVNLITKRGRYDLGPGRPGDLTP